MLTAIIAPVANLFRGVGGQKARIDQVKEDAIQMAIAMALGVSEPRYASWRIPWSSPIIVTE